MPVLGRGFRVPGAGEVFAGSRDFSFPAHRVQRGAWGVRVLITGMSGTGKSAVIQALAERGYRAVDADEAGWSEVVTVPEEELTGLGPGQDWVWREDRIREVLAGSEGETLFIGGCSPNQGQFYPWFDHIILLSAPADVIVERLATRTTNPFGKQPDEVARTLRLLEEVEPLLRRGAGHEIDTRAPLEEVVERVIRIAEGR